MRARASPYLMEVNGRFWGSLQLAIDAGVDFPALLVAARRRASRALAAAAIAWACEAAGGGATSTSCSRAGARARRRSRSRADAPSRLRATLDFLTFWHPHDRSDVFRVSDPRPFFRETIEWLHRR